MAPTTHHHFLERVAQVITHEKQTKILSLIPEIAPFESQEIDVKGEKPCHVEITANLGLKQAESVKLKIKRPSKKSLWGATTNFLKNKIASLLSLS
ncbi:hypothetical protein [Mesonia aestuariivivens]|uniref:Uncharacterized protein n=1 Tax=Mesonia aestuariivivens TaxID=2796128 RepID=A0ABS6W5Z4_9FLAO|nr:hypothetical protein [Mesonia aestuariivivens]MBW2962921.1 hypothetical protein [Mesonia aestuariivivens]